jgi:hypothetical protein
MDCSQFRKYLDNYENLDDLQLKFLHEHAEVCEDCRSELDFFNSVINTVASVPVPEMPADFIEQVNKRIDAEPAKKGFIYNFSIASKKYAAVAACIAIGLVVGLNRTDIEDKLNGTDDSGVIKSEVATAIPTELPVVPTEKATQTPAAEEGVSVETEKVTVPTVKPTAKPTVKPMQKPVSKPEAKATVKPTVKPVVKTELEQTEKTTANVVVPTVPVQEPEKKTSEAKVQETNTDKPVSVVATAENVEKNYTIEREEYYVPENEDVTVAVTAEPDVSSYSLATAEPETKYSYREQPTVTPVASTAIADYLLVSAEDIDAVVSILNDLGIARAHGLYMTQTNNFYELLARLGDRNISYDYSVKYTTGDKISFKILLK